MAAAGRESDAGEREADAAILLLLLWVYSQRCDSNRRGAVVPRASPVGGRVRRRGWGLRNRAQ